MPPLCTPPFLFSLPRVGGTYSFLLGGFAPTAPESGRSARSWLCHDRRPGLLSCEKKVDKDSPGTSWSLDLRHKGEDPLGFPRPSALAVLVEGKKARGILGAIPAEPRIENRECDPRFSLGRNKDRLAHQLKVANRAGFVAETLSRGLRHRRRGSEASP